MSLATLRKITAALLEPASDSGLLGKMVDLSIVALILLNVMSVLLLSMPSMHDHHLLLESFNLFSVALFTVEYGMRIWCCVERDDSSHPNWRKRINYMTSPLALVDLMAILPFYISLLFAVDLRLVWVLRLFRVFKLNRYSGAMKMMLKALQLEYRVLMAAMFLLSILMVLIASGMYALEHEAQPDKFGSIPDSMWWAIITLTTVGYGDVTPITPLGRIFTGLITLLGTAMVALPAGILASSFTEQLRQRRETFTRRAAEAIEDGILSEEDRHALNQLRLELGLERAQAVMLFDKAYKNYQEKHQHPYLHSCPHCGKSLDKVVNKENKE